jgi:hypothetical protein
MAHTQLFLTHGVSTVRGGKAGKPLLRAAINKAMGCISGSERDVNYTWVGSSTDPATACTAGISAAGNGAVGIVVAGVTLTATWATSDTVSAGLVAAVINASTNAKIQYLIGSSTLRTDLTLVTTVAGDVVNLAGYRFTGVAGTAATIPDKPGNFVIKGSGTDTQSATSLAGAINQHPGASKYLYALNIAGVVSVFAKTTNAAWFTGPNAPLNKAVSMASTIAVSSATFAAGAYYGLWCKIPGKIGNNIVVAASGTGQSIENSNTYFSRGLGGDAAPVMDTL